MHIKISILVELKKFLFSIAKLISNFVYHKGIYFQRTFSCELECTRKSRLVYTTDDLKVHSSDAVKISRTKHLCWLKPKCTASCSSKYSNTQSDVLLHEHIGTCDCQLRKLKATVVYLNLITIFTYFSTYSSPWKCPICDTTAWLILGIY